MKPFLEALDERTLICDGAMGTMLYSKGIFLNRCFDELNLTQPDLVAGIHQSYVRAGAEVLETNTFGANPVKLATFGLAEKVHAINLQGVRIARHAARDLAYVAGAIGPLGVRVEPWGKTGLDEAEAAFRLQAQALAEGGVDLFMLETFRDLRELGAAVRAVRAVSDRPVVAQLTTGEDGLTIDGTPPEQFTPALEALDADVIGLNCSVGPAVMLETIERMAELTNARLSVQPNAGRPRDVEGRNIYLSSPEYMASYARRFVGAGVRIVGGCCGTTPEHTAQMRVAARSVTGHASPRGRSLVVPAELPAVEPVPRAEKSRLANAIARGRFVVAVELDPPRGHACDGLVEEARRFRIRGVDAVLVADRAGSGARMSALAMAVLLERQAAVDTVLQFTCRDRRLGTLQTELLGAHAMGLRNLLIVTGEPLRQGDYADATAVFEVDSIGLMNAVTRLNHGCDVGGQPLGGPTAFHSGVRINPGAPNLEEEVRRYAYKAEAGAEFALTEPVFDPVDLAHFVARTTAIALPLLVTIRPFESLRDAEWLANEMPGLRVPPSLVERMRVAESEGRAEQEGVAIALDLARAVRPHACGLLVSYPLGRPDLARQVIEGLPAEAGSAGKVVQ
jgi:homocysteine S-methyltransferase